MKKNLSILIALLFVSFVQAQYTTIYQNSFRNWTLSNDWQIIDNDTSAGSIGVVTKSVTAGVPIPSTEIMDYMLGVKSFSGACNQFIISPEFQLGSNPWLQCYSYRFTGPAISMWILPNPANTGMSGITDSIQLLSVNGYNSISLSAYANTSVRVAFKITGTNPTTYIDDLHLFNKESLVYIPDAAFRNKVKTIVPAAFVGDSLDYTTNAAVSLRRISAPNLGIASIEGLQHFPFLRSFIANNNQIEEFPIDRMPYLDTLIVNYNLISVLPDMPIARALTFDHNLVKTIPDFLNQQVGRLYGNDNLIKGCLTCSNRFVNGSVLNNVSLYVPCNYYYLLHTNTLLADAGPCLVNTGKVKGKVYYDINLNGIADANEPLFDNQSIQFFQSADLFTNSNGGYEVITEGGPVQMNVVNLPSYFSCTNPLDSAVLAGETLNHDFRIVAVSQVNDLKVNVVRNTSYISSFGANASVFAKNLGTTPITAVIKFPVPAGITILSSELGTVVNDTLVWTSVINPLETVLNFISLQADATLNFHVVELNACGTIANDLNLLDNCSSAYFYKQSAVQPPHDPNYKLVSTPIVDTNFQDDLYYTIRFENIGGGNATYVKVRDQLPTQLDGTTFELIGSTHPVTVSYGTDQLIQFTFNNITLTPRAVDSTQSFGFIWFKIKPLNPMQLGDTIKNFASIIFNTEAPIITEKSIVYVNSLRIANNTVPDAHHFCLGDTLSFSDLSSPYPTHWDVSSTINPQFHETASQGKLPLDSIGTFTITQITQWETGARDTLVRTIVVGQPEIQISDIPTICHQNQSVVLNQALPIGGTYSGLGISNNLLDASSLAIGVNSLNYSYTDQYGCSNSTTANFLVEDDYSAASNLAICFGDSLVWEGMAYSIPGTYSVMYARASGCDSILSLNLAVGNELHYMDTLTTCQGTNVQWENMTLSVTGDYESDMVSVNGCDSIHYLHLNVHPLFDMNDEVSLCNGTGINWQGQYLQTAGLHEIHYVSQFGCDSSYYMEVTFLDIPETISNQTICSGSQVYWNGNYIDAAGNYSDTLVSQMGCDSITKLNLNVHPLFDMNDEVSLCNGTGINWQGQYLQTAGLYEIHYVSQFGCDSSYYMEVTFLDIPETISNQTICSGSQVYWNGNYIDAAGNYSDTLVSQMGCDSITKLNLTVQSLDVNLQLTDSSLLAVPGMDSYVWLNCSTNTILSGETTEEFVFAENGIYATVVSGMGCIDTSSCYTIDFLELKKGFDLNGLQVFPNPFGSNLTIIGTAEGTMDYSLCTLLGQEIAKGTFRNQQIIETGELVSGFYFLKVSYRESQRIIKLEHIESN
jgi:uncharacterized repeat protein (TIGR01451 family)